MTADPHSTIQPLPHGEPQVRNERYRVRFDNRAQAAYCARIAGANRFVWNLVLTICEWRYDRHLAEKESDPEAKPPGTSAFDLFKLFTVVRSRPQEEWYLDFLQSDRGEYYRDRDLAWLRDLPFAPVRYSLKYLADSYKRFYKAAKEAKKQGRKLPRRKSDGKPQGFPRRKGFGVKCDGFTIPDGVRMDGERLRIPKAGWVRLDGSGQYLGCDAKQVRIIREGTEDRPKWYAIVSYHVTPDRLKQPAWTGALGVDRNVGQATDSDGVVYESPDDSLIDTKIKRKQRELSRKKGWGPKTRGQKKSNRGRRVNGQLKKLHRKKKRRRENAAHQHSRKIANTAHTVVLEDLNTAAMTKSAKGTVEEPGLNVKQKSGLNRSVLASGWGALDRNLDYKAGAVKRINPAYTSQTCSHCGNVNKENRKTQANFNCTACGFKANADHNAAINILVGGGFSAPDPTARGTGATARRDALGHCLGPPAQGKSASTTREQDMPPPPGAAASGDQSGI
ncbi:MAG: transposase [Caldilineaceae bacterium SB0661_bin_34]|nr:transposase [Caldilineaceae bacterium SB0661_bin_34]